MKSCMSFPLSSFRIYLTVPIPRGCILPAIPFTGEIDTCLGGVMKSSYLGVIDTDAPVSNNIITPVFV